MKKLDDKMKLTIVYDNDVYKKDMSLKSDWGFSCLIETPDDTVLFDTGAKGDILLQNMKKLRIDPSIINKIVISHEHWDHNGGLKSLSPFIGDVDLYELTNSQPYINMHLKTPEEPEKIIENIWTTGRIKGSVDEQSLILKNNNDLYVLTGCSHPGIKKILQIAKQFGNIRGILGGFHGFNEFSLFKDMNLICPCHCTVNKNELNSIYPNVTFKCGVGRVIDLGVK